MLVEREKLENEIFKVISYIYSNKKVVNKFYDNMYKLHNVRLDSSMDIIGKHTDLNDVSKDFLVWITKELETAVKEDNDTSYLASGLKLEKYFTPIEINESKDKKLSIDYEKEKYPIVFNKVLKVNDDQWVTVEPVEFISDLREKQIINNNWKTQRERTLRKTISGFIYVPNIIKKAVNQIFQLMLDKKFISNAITFNMPIDETQFEYDEDNMSLNVYGKMDITDGNHRFIAMTKAKRFDSNFHYNTIINITNFSEDKAKQFIVQEDKRNPIRKSKIKSMDVSNYGTKVANNLNENSNSNLEGLLGAERGKLIDIGLFIDLINFNFDIKTTSDLLDVKKYTLDAFNALTEDNRNLLSEKQNNLVWIFYVRIMKEFFGARDIDGFISKIHKINELDFDKLNIKVNSISKPLYKKIDNIITNI